MTSHVSASVRRLKKCPQFARLSFWLTSVRVVRVRVRLNESRFDCFNSWVENHSAVPSGNGFLQATTGEEAMPRRFQRVNRWPMIVSGACTAATSPTKFVVDTNQMWDSHLLKIHNNSYFNAIQMLAEQSSRIYGYTDKLEAGNSNGACHLTAICCWLTVKQ